MGNPKMGCRGKWKGLNLRSSVMLNHIQTHLNQWIPSISSQTHRRPMVLCKFYFKYPRHERRGLQKEQTRAFVFVVFVFGGVTDLS